MKRDWLQRVLLMIITVCASVGTALAWRIYDRVESMEQTLSAVVEKIGGIHH